MRRARVRVLLVSPSAVRPRPPLALFHLRISQSAFPSHQGRICHTGFTLILSSFQSGPKGRRRSIAALAAFSAFSPAIPPIRSLAAFWTPTRHTTHSAAPPRHDARAYRAALLPLHSTARARGPERTRQRFRLYRGRRDGSGGRLARRASRSVGSSFRSVGGRAAKIRAEGVCDAMQCSGERGYIDSNAAWCACGFPSHTTLSNTSVPSRDIAS